MERLLLSLIIGVIIGIIDIIPMIIQKLERKSTISAFLQYFFVSIIIINIDLPGIPWYLEGSIISFVLALPVIVIVSGKDKKSVPVIAIMSIVLGALISIAGYLFI